MVRIYKSAWVFTWRDFGKIFWPLNRCYRGIQTLHLRNGASVTVSDIFSYELGQVVSFFYHDEYRLGDITLRENPIIFDLGANMGLFSIAAKSRYPTATIVAYEPHPATFALLKKNAPFATVYQCAAAGKTGMVHIQADGKSIERKLVDEGGIPVEAQSLDDILFGVDHVDLLKVDIEGAEFELFEQAHEATIAKIKDLIIEVHGKDTGEFVYNRDGKK